MQELIYLNLNNIKRYIPDGSILTVDRIEDDTIILETIVDDNIFMIITLYSDDMFGFPVKEGCVLRIEDEEIFKSAELQRIREEEVADLFERLKAKK